MFLGTLREPAHFHHERRETLLKFDAHRNAKAKCDECIATNTCEMWCLWINHTCFGDIYQPHPNYCRFLELVFREAQRVHYILRSERNETFLVMLRKMREQGAKSREQGAKSGEQRAKSEG